MGRGNAKKKKTAKGKALKEVENIDHGDQETSANKKSKQAQRSDVRTNVTHDVGNYMEIF